MTGIKNGLTLNGGTVSSRGLTYPDQWGNLFLLSNITAGGAATSTIASEINLSGNRTITVDTGSTLNVTGKINAWNVPRSGITKEGTGTLVLSGANGYNGVTDITAGTLVAANSSALGESGWSRDNMTWVRDGATLALQGGVSIPDHMHVFGAGVGGLGAIRSLSGNNALTMNNGNSGSGPGYSIDCNTTIGVDADTLRSPGSTRRRFLRHHQGRRRHAETHPGEQLHRRDDGQRGYAGAGPRSGASEQHLAERGDFRCNGHIQYVHAWRVEWFGQFVLAEQWLNCSGVALRSAITIPARHIPASPAAQEVVWSRSAAAHSPSPATTAIAEPPPSREARSNSMPGPARLAISPTAAASLVFNGSSVVTGGTLHFQSFNPQLTISGNADVTLTGGITHQPSIPAILTMPPTTPSPAAPCIPHRSPVRPSHGTRPGRPCTLTAPGSSPPGQPGFHHDHRLGPYQHYQPALHQRSHL